MEGAKENQSRCPECWHPECRCADYAISPELRAYAQKVKEEIREGRWPRPITPGAEPGAKSE